MPIILPARVRAFAPDISSLIRNPGSNLIGAWGPERGLKNLAASGHDGTLADGARIQPGALGPCINGTNYRITCASGDGDDIAGDWNVSTSTIVIVGENFTGTCWVRGDSADYLYYHGSVITYIAPSYSTSFLYQHDKTGHYAELFGKDFGSGNGPVAVGFITAPYGGTCYVAARGKYASVTSNGIQMNNDGVCQWNFGSYFLDWGLSTARPTGELYGWMAWNRGMGIKEMMMRLEEIQRALDG